MTDVRRIKLREQNRLRKRKQRENQKLPASCDSHTLSRDGHATDMEREEDKDKDKDKREECEEKTPARKASVKKPYEMITVLSPWKTAPLDIWTLSGN